jgi:hypothetical protein
VNGADVSVENLVARAGALKRAFSDLRIDVIEHVEIPGGLVLVFCQRGSHVGPVGPRSAWSSPPEGGSRHG